MGDSFQMESRSERQYYSTRLFIRFLGFRIDPVKSIQCRSYMQLPIDQGYDYCIETEKILAKTNRVDRKLTITACCSCIGNMVIRHDGSLVAKESARILLGMWI